MNKWGSRWIRPQKRLAIYMRDEWTCAYCGINLHGALPSEVTLDHLTPRAECGGNEPENLTTACRYCNTDRGAKPWHEYASPSAARRIVSKKRESLGPYLRMAKAIRAGKVGDENVEVR